MREKSGLQVRLSPSDLAEIVDAIFWRYNKVGGIFMDYKMKYQAWLDSSVINDATKEEPLLTDEGEIE